MNRFDDLPKRDRNHALEELAMSAFQQRLTESGVFVLQGVDRKDYGSDRLIEAVDGERATNARSQVQLKGTERAPNVDGSVAVEVARTNLNYLMLQKHGFYVCYHAPTSSLLCCSVDQVLRQYDRSGTNWTSQKTVTVAFRDELTIDRLRSLAALIHSGATSTRDRRNEQVVADAVSIPSLLRNTVPAVHVPSDRQVAAELLQQLYEGGADDVISAAFDEFAAVLGDDDDAMGLGYMAEINRGMDGCDPARPRIERAVGHFRRKLSERRFQPGSLHYTIGNALSALGDEAAAKLSYEAAVADRRYMGVPSFAAQVMKNLGTSEHLQHIV